MNTTNRYRPKLGPPALARLRELHAAGWTQQAIADKLHSELGVDVSQAAVSKRLRHIGNAPSKRARGIPSPSQPSFEDEVRNGPIVKPQRKAAPTAYEPSPSLTKYTVGRTQMLELERLLGRKFERCTE